MKAELMTNFVMLSRDGKSIGETDWTHSGFETNK